MGPELALLVGSVGADVTAKTGHFVTHPVAVSGEVGQMFEDLATLLATVTCNNQSNVNTSAPGNKEGRFGTCADMCSASAHI